MNKKKNLSDLYPDLSYNIREFKKRIKFNIKRTC